MSYNTTTQNLTQTTGAGRAVSSVFVAGVMFVLGYTVVRVSLAETSQLATTDNNADVQVVIPGEGTLWADFGTSF